MELFTKVADLLASHLGVDASTITPESDIVKDLGADSLDIVEMLMTLEDELDIIIPDDATGIKTVKDIAAFIENEMK